MAHSPVQDSAAVQAPTVADASASKKRAREEDGVPAQEGWRVRRGAKADAIKNPIRQIMDSIADKTNANKRMISLAQGDPTTYPHLRPCEVMVNSVVNLMHGGTMHGYQNSQGNAACRAAVAEAFTVPGRPRLTPNDVFMTLGCSEALSHCIAALAGDGGNMLLPRPGFPLYEVLCQYHNLEIRHYDLYAERGWQADPAELARVADSNTRAILVNNPSNPCGAVYPRAHLVELLAAVEALRIPVIADEVYAGMTFKEPFVPCAEAAPRVPVLSVCALSKRWLAPGWRVGWITVHDADSAFASAGIPEAILKMCQITLGPSAPLQAAVPEIIRSTPTEWYDRVLRDLEASAKCCVRRCSKCPGLEVASEPQGSMYFMVRLKAGVLKDIDTDDVAFAGLLLQEESVAVLPGQCFQAPGFFRVVFAAPEQALDEAWDRIEDFCRRRAQTTA